MNKIKIATAFLVFLAACATAVKVESPKRFPSGVGEKIVSPTGLMTHEFDQADYDEALFEHLSEGSDIYPYDWLKVLRSDAYSTKKEIKLFLSELDGRFGLLRETVPSNFLMPYAGMTASWSNHPPESSDAFKKDEQEKVRTINGVKSVKMVGINCAACHSGEVRFESHPYHVDGAPNMANIRGFFKDMASSTIATLFDQKILKKFLDDLQVPNSEKQSKKIHDYFCKEFGKQTGLGVNILCASTFVTLAVAKKLDWRGRLFKGSEALGATLEKLLRVTYGLSETDDIGELKQRMRFFGRLMVGTDPRTGETVSGWGRTDAFGRIGNLVLREDPIDYTAPVSLPWVWGIKHMALLHYAANTNSVMLRNMGQALGLGAMVLDKKTGQTTVNVYNLNRLERLIHKIKVPRWEEYFPEGHPLAVNSTLAITGKAIYDQKCASCHTAKPVGAGPLKILYSYNIIPQPKINTDPQALRNLYIPVKGKEFSDSIYDATENVKQNYYVSHHFTDAQIKEYEFFDLRGKEFFKHDKHLAGYATEAEEKQFNYGPDVIDHNDGYKARNLAGIWATAPYLHNGSVPTIRDLLTPAAKRPIIFNVGTRELDLHNMGFVSQRDFFGKAPVPCGEKEDSCFDTRKLGNHNSGHEYGSDLDDSNKTALIEYLKILPAEIYYQ